MAEKNPLAMTDEEFSKLNSPADLKIDSKEDPKEDNVAEKQPEEKDNSGSEDQSKEPQEEQKQESEDNSSEPDNKENGEANQRSMATPEDKTTSSGSAETPSKTTERDRSGSSDKKDTLERSDEKGSKIDYEGFYKEIMKPFKANGKLFTPRDPQEAIRLMQMGANYSKKMQSIAPYRKVLLMLENNNLLDENKLSFLIDLEKKNPEAIKKLLKDAEIDPVDIDTTEEPKYQPGAYKVTDEEAAFMNVLQDIKESENGLATLRELQKWDGPSKDVLWNNPELARIIHVQMQNGVYNRIVQEMERDRVLGNIPPTMPFLAAYKQTGDRLMQQTQAPQQVQQKPIATRASVQQKHTEQSVKERVKQAAPNRTIIKNKAGNIINPLAMSDEDFLKQLENRL